MIADACALATIEFALRGYVPPESLPVVPHPRPVSAAQNGRSVCEATTMTHRVSVATWTPERVEQLRTCVVNGLTCSQIAAEIGVTRNAIIGKIHRLGLKPLRSPGTPARTCPPRTASPRFSQRKLLRLMFAEAPSLAADQTADPDSIESTQRCSLLDLAAGRCRWPVADPVGDCRGADFVFCGNEAVTGFSYCAGHARMAYRLPARQRA